VTETHKNCKKHKKRYFFR